MRPFSTYREKWPECHVLACDSSAETQQQLLCSTFALLSLLNGGLSMLRMNTVVSMLTQSPGIRSFHLHSKLLHRLPLEQGCRRCCSGMVWAFPTFSSRWHTGHLCRRVIGYDIIVKYVWSIKYLEWVRLSGMTHRLASIHPENRAQSIFIGLQIWELLLQMEFLRVQSLENWFLTYTCILWVRSCTLHVL